jgi:hypothetical protein
MDEFKNISRKLSELKKETPFRTPDNYFDDFSARMDLARKQEENNPLEKKTNIIQILKPALGLAASFALIFMLVYVPLKTFIPSDQTVIVQSEDYSDTDFLNIIEDIDESSFFALLDDVSQSSELTEDDLSIYVSANFSSYEIFEKLED